MIMGTETEAGRGGQSRYHFTLAVLYFRARPVFLLCSKCCKINNNHPNFSFCLYPSGPGEYKDQEGRIKHQSRLGPNQQTKSHALRRTDISCWLLS